MSKENQIFTPEWATNEMIDMLSPGDLTADETYFFEPSCGDGAMLLVIVGRIFEALNTKYAAMSDKTERALAETAVKFFAIELDAELVVKCRLKIYEWFLNKLNGEIDVGLFSQYLMARIVSERIQQKDLFEFFGKGHPMKK